MNLTRPLIALAVSAPLVLVGIAPAQASSGFIKLECTKRGPSGASISAEVWVDKKSPHRVALNTVRTIDPNNAYEEPRLRVKKNTNEAGKIITTITAKAESTTGGKTLKCTDRRTAATL